MKRIIAVVLLALGSLTLAPAASAMTEEQACDLCRTGAVLVYKLTRLIG